MNGEGRMEISGEDRERLEMDEDFRALRHRFYKLGKERRRKLLSQLRLLPDIPEREISQDVEKRLLFECVLRGRLDTLKADVEREEAEIAAEDAAKKAQ